MPLPVIDEEYVRRVAVYQSVLAAVSEVYTMVGGREGGQCDDSRQ